MDKGSVAVLRGTGLGDGLVSTNPFARRDNLAPSRKVIMEDGIYCVNGCGNLAIGESTTGIIMEAVDEDGYCEVVELLCGECLLD